MAILSVIITTRNRRKLLTRAIESVIDAGKDIEIIVVDDASDDGTMEDWQGHPGICYIRLEKNLGTAAARNAGIRKSASPVIAFLDDDDYRLPGTLLRQLEIFNKNPQCGVVYGKVVYSNQQGELTGHSNIDSPSPEGDILVTMLSRNFITLSAAMVRKECFERVGYFDESTAMLGIEDWDMWLRIAEHYPFCVMNEAVAAYRRPEKDSGQWYSDIGRQFTRAAKAYHNKWLKMATLKNKLGKDFGKTKNNILSGIADIIIFGALYNGTSKRKRIKGMFDAVRCQPRIILRPGFYKAFLRSIFPVSQQHNDSSTQR
jgi:glycosyltransferase involved in cell wall biosynthesis